ncbi:hypothetical protein OKW29_000880 [Paraburkholderia sp. CI3]
MTSPRGAPLRFSEGRLDALVRNTSARYGGSDFSSRLSDFVVAIDSKIRYESNVT